MNVISCAKEKKEGIDLKGLSKFLPSAHLEHFFDRFVLDFIRHMLTPNPKFRPDVHEIIEITEKFDSLSAISLNVSFFYTSIL